MITQQTWEWAHNHSRTGKSPVWTFEFAHQSPYHPVPGHAEDVPYYFGCLPGNPGPEDWAVANLVMSGIVNFASYGDPNGPGVPAWPVYRANDRQTMLIRKDPRSFALDAARYEFFAGLRDKNGMLPMLWRPPSGYGS